MSSNKSLFNLRSYGLLEFILAIYFILLPYSIGNIGFEIINPFILLILCIIRTNLRFYPTTHAFRILVGYVLFQQIALCLVIGAVPSYHINSWLLLFINLISIFIVIPAVNFQKLLNVFKLVTIIVIVGELYHVALMMMGADITPIKIPFLPFNEHATRLTEIGSRPVSFFLEPSNLAQFFIFPLFFSLYYKRFVYSGIIILAILLTTSTNGVVVAATMVLVYVLTQKVKTSRKILLSLAAIVFVFAYTNLSVFSSGRDKIESTDIEATSRLVNGPTLVKSMPFDDLIFGFPAPNVDDYVSSGAISSAGLILGHNGNYYVSSFLLTIAKYGIIGMILFLLAYYSIYKKNHGLIIVLLPLFILKFSGGAMFNSATLVWTTFMFSFIEYEKNKETLNKQMQ